MSDDIDLAFRPKAYFRPEKLEKYLLSKVKGAVLRKKLKALFEAGRHEELQHLIDDVAFSDADRKVLESLHPTFMGGNYLPDTEDGEVEIARISIRSTTSDVTSVYARSEAGVIHYRVVDEYGGDTLQGRSETSTNVPMTLGELENFFFTAWPLMDLLEMYYEDDVDGALGFFSADSDFYPEFDRLCRHRVRENFPETDDSDECQFGDECHFCGYLNSPPAGDICAHAIAWVWDGQIDILRTGESLGSTLKDLAEVLESADEDSPIRAILDAQALRSQSRENVIESASLPLAEAIEKLAGAVCGGGWSTNGSLGGSGYTLYVESLEDMSRLADECLAILKACALNIRTKGVTGKSLEAYRPDAPLAWQFVASGFWSEDTYHSGHVAYFIANPRPGCWIMEARERNAILDDVTEEDVEEGRLNDDQIQAMWGQTLEQAQNEEYRHIVAWCEDVDAECAAEEMAAVLYRAVCTSGGNEISEPDRREGLLAI